MRRLAWLASLGLLCACWFAAPARAQVPKILLYGDSLTAGYPAAGNPGYAPRLAAIGWDVSNRAASGQQKATGVWVLEQGLATGAISSGSQAVVLMWGSNDLDNGGIPLHPDCLTGSLAFWQCHFQVVRPELLEQVAAIQALGLYVVVAFPPPQYPPQPAASNVNLEFTRFLVKRDLEDMGVAIVDFYDEFQAMGYASMLMAADGVHLNDLGDFYLAVRIDQMLRAGGLAP